MNFIRRNQNVLLLHFTVLIWGFTGVLGELISISALPLVWYRVLIAALSLFVYFKIKRRSIRVPIGDLFKFFGVGLIVGLHWVTFFHAIKVSTVSVALVTLSSATLFAAVLEPLINKRKTSVADVVVGLIIIVGLYLIFKFEFQYIEGICYGLFCALCASIFAILNARMVKKTSPTIITFYEMIGAFIGVSVVMLVTGQFSDQLILSTKDWTYLLLLGTVCTALAYALGVAVMKELSAFAVALATNMEPIYGIIIAILIFGNRETMSVGFYVGAVVVLAAVFLYPYLKKKWSKKKIVSAAFPVTSLEEQKNIE
jgi:drug/metabolite transporter (DMT)-like permease